MVHMIYSLMFNDPSTYMTRNDIYDAPVRNRAPVDSSLDFILDQAFSAIVRDVIKRFGSGQFISCATIKINSVFSI